MKDRKFIATVFAIGVLSVCFSCERKDLYYPPQSKLRLITHWEEDIQERPYYNKAIFYPTNGEKEYQYYIDKDTMLLSIPVGEYHMIFYNWRTNASAQTVQFRNHLKYTDMTSFTGALMNKAGYFEKYNLFLNPDMLYSWTTEEHEASKVVTFSSKNDLISTLHTYPKRVSHEYNFHVEVIGLEYVRAVSAAALGFAPELTMYNKQASDTDAGHNLEIKLTETGFQCHFGAYNHYKPNDQRLLFAIKLPDGSIREYPRDLNEELDKKGTIEHVEKIVIEFDGPVTSPSPGGNGGFAPPEIGDWEGIEEDIVFPSK